MMKSQEIFENFVLNCNIKYKGKVISKEDIIRDYIKYLTSTNVETRHNVGVVMHTGSFVFDVISILIGGISCYLFNDLDVEEMMESLDIGDLVILNKSQKVRYAFNGIVNLNGPRSHVKLVNDKKDNLYMPRKSWYQIEPYNGDSKRLDGRGLRNGINKSEIISKILNIDIVEIPTIVDKSVVIVSNKERINDILDNVKISCNGEDYGILDIFTTSYYSESEEIFYRGNPCHNEPILKITSKVSKARDLVTNKSGNKTLGVFFLGSAVDSTNNEIYEISRRKSLKFVYLCSTLDNNFIEEFKDNEMEIKYFICTPLFLTEKNYKVNHKNIYTDELYKQIYNIVSRDVETIELANDDVKGVFELKKVLLSMRSHETNQKVSNFIIDSFVLINLFTTAIFPLETLEVLIESGQIGIQSPKSRLHTMKKNLLLLPDTLIDKCEGIINTLENTYFRLLINNVKFHLLKNYVWNNVRRKIAIIIAKEYYIDVLKKLSLDLKHMGTGNLDITTPNRFNKNKVYDDIFVIGTISNSKFDMFKVISSSSLYIMVYEHECKFIKYMEIKYILWMKYLNQLIGYKIENVESTLSSELTYSNNEVLDEIIVDQDLINYLDKLKEHSLTSYIAKNRYDAKSTILSIAQATTAEGYHLLFSKEYKAYVYC